uniref:polysaccharide deacetylase family protein n=1 Tax=Vaginimicrobium propionicum TaxID=1871034 RepID=UPI0018D2905A|nr:polysaccharide deacetylase family protein [Vaginimicrobium propionicum]
MEKCVALTFDDGPGPNTEKLLDELAEADVLATFFLVGRNIANNVDVVKRMAAAGHQIGNHSWSHADFLAVGPAAAEQELTATSDLIEQITGTRPTMARPPYGAFNDQTPRCGMSFVTWRVDTQDWKNRDSAITTQRALDGVYPGAIILMHDIHPTTVDAVPGLIKQLRELGYVFATVPELWGGELIPGEDYLGGPTPSASPSDPA